MHWSVKNCRSLIDTFSLCVFSSVCVNITASFWMDTTFLRNCHAMGLVSTETVCSAIYPLNIDLGLYTGPVYCCYSLLLCCITMPQLLLPYFLTRAWVERCTTYVRKDAYSRVTQGNPCSAKRGVHWLIPVADLHNNFLPLFDKPPKWLISGGCSATVE